MKLFNNFDYLMADNVIGMLFCRLLTFLVYLYFKDAYMSHNCFIAGQMLHFSEI